MKRKELLLTDEELLEAYYDDTFKDEAELNYFKNIIEEPEALRRAVEAQLQKIIDRGDIYIRLPEVDIRLNQRLKEEEGFYMSVNYPTKIYPFIPLAEAVKE